MQLPIKLNCYQWFSRVKNDALRAQLFRLTLRSSWSNAFDVYPSPQDALCGAFSWTLCEERPIHNTILNIKEWDDLYLLFLRRPNKVLHDAPPTTLMYLPQVRGLRTALLAPALDLTEVYAYTH